MMLLLTRARQVLTRFMRPRSSVTNGIVIGTPHLQPTSRKFGFDRGLPIDRHYIESFLKQSAADIHGRVMEIADATYTKRFGGNKVEQADVLHAVAGNPHATIVGDLATGEGIPVEVFDCVILTQTLNVVWDTRSVIANVFKSLKPGGVLLATFPGISQISRYDMDRWGDYWRFTSRSAQLLFEESFTQGHVTVETFGNVVAAVSFLQGLATEEMSADELAYKDPDYQLLITVRAQKPGGAF